MRPAKQPPPSTICCKQGNHIKKYICGRRLGTGGFANVYQVESMDSHRIYACKVINKSMLKRKEHQSKLISELKIHSAMQHKNIVKFGRFFEDKQNVYILLELCTNQSMMELTRKRHHLTEHEVRYFMHQLLVAIKYLHSKSVIHRDLKLGNILLDAHLDIKICDFGLATRFDGDRKTTICGTPNYIAPEILNQRRLGHGHSFEVDIWSLGVVMFTLLTGKPPFETRNIEETYRRINKTRYQWPVNGSHSISHHAKDLVAKILNVDPNKRPNLMQMNAHPFFTNCDIPKRLPLCILKRKPRENELFVNIDDCKTNVKQNVITISKQSNHNKVFKNNLNHLNEPQQPQPIKYKPETPQRHVKPCAAQEMKSTTEDDEDGFIFVVKHCDYSKKYGVGYILSNGFTGIWFNDSTKMLLHRDKQSVTYFDDEDAVNHCCLERFPGHLSKKIKLLQYFYDYLWKKTEQNNAEMKRIRQKLLTKDWKKKNKKEENVFVRRWLKEKYATLFRLTDHTVQVNFTDSSKLVFQDSTLVMYEDKNGDRNIYTLNQIYDSNRKDLKKRFQYTLQLLQRIQSNK
eukprot:13166_1